MLVKMHKYKKKEKSNEIFTRVCRERLWPVCRESERGESVIFYVRDLFNRGISWVILLIKYRLKSRLRDWMGWDKWVKIGHFRQFVKNLLVFNRKMDVRDKLLSFKR